jgi:RNA polymerase sigma-70 factor (sigma-E family)
MASSADEFTAAYAELRGAAYRAAYRLLGDRGAAEDIAAEALTRAYARWASVGDHALPWVIKVAGNLALDLGRRRARDSARKVLIDRANPDPQLEERLDLHRALAALPRRQREVVVLRFLGDFSEQATADALGIDPGTVKSHCSRALSKLRQTVERV